MSVTSKFIQAFDSKNVEHVAWLGAMCDIAEKLGEAMDMQAEINKNPMNIKIQAKDALDWPHIHFCLCAVYAKAVLNGKAFIPKPPSS
jgi:hypothetical protein